MLEQSDNKINDGIKEYQKKAREQTISSIKEAVQILNDLGKKVTVSRLVEMTGLHRTTFYKPEIRPIWDTKKSSNKLQLDSISRNNNIEDLKKIVAQLQNDNEKLHKKYLNILEQKEDLLDKNKKLNEKIDEVKHTNEILRGQILSLQNENKILKNY